MSDNEITTLYRALLDAWNARDAGRYASIFAVDGHVVGFDGSQVDGCDAIESSMRQIFEHHKTGTYAGIVRELQQLAPGVAMLRAVAGMTPYGEQDLKPELNAIQTLVAVKQDESWRIAMFQNTPAAFHGRPEEVLKLTDELRAGRETTSRS
jgi:uncharacterized protein (TIGR02246 family)